MNLVEFFEYQYQYMVDMGLWTMGDKLGLDCGVAIANKFDRFILEILNETNSD